MFIERAYAERESLSDLDLHRLRSALIDEVDRYKFAIRNYPPDRRQKHGAPFLAGLEEKVRAVEELIQDRSTTG